MGRRRGHDWQWRAHVAAAVVMVVKWEEGAMRAAGVARSLRLVGRRAGGRAC